MYVYGIILCRLEIKTEDLETKAKLSFLNHEELRARLLTNLEDSSFVNFIWESLISIVVHN